MNKVKPFTTIKLKVDQEQGQTIHNNQT